MRIGVNFPQTEIGADAGAVRAYVQAVEGMGFSHLSIFDHVIGASTEHRPDWTGPYSAKDMLHEPLVLFGFIAGLTRTLALTTGILILPQRQTTLVAKQAAEIDILTGGRLRLGVGLGWNQVEYQALNENFHNRGKRIEEQAAVLRALWTDPIVTFHGQWHHIVEAGLNPMPVQRPIPLWMGGSNEAVLRRIGRLADGWFPGGQPNESVLAAIERIQGYAREAGRDPRAIGIEGGISGVRGGPEDWGRLLASWRSASATHLSVSTTGGGLAGPDAHIAALRKVKDAIGAGIVP